MCMVRGTPKSCGGGPERVVVGVAVGPVRVDVGGDGEAPHAPSGGPLHLGQRDLDVGQAEAADAEQAVGRDRAVVEHPVVVALEHRRDHVAVGDGEGEHVERRVHHLAHDAVDRLLVEPLVRVAHARVQALVAPGDALVGPGVVEAVAGDAEAADGDRECIGQDEPVARPPLPVVLDPGSTRAEAALQALEHLSGLDHVGVTREVAHHHHSRPPPPGGESGRRRQPSAVVTARANSAVPAVPPWSTGRTRPSA